jgi:dihydrofolate synthase/folylpolyglutamate synthase
MSMLYFKHKEVDVMIMEVGLGGLLDATNVLNYDLSLITSIGFDHMKQLGNTLESIASNKLGILKPGNHLITTVDPKLHDYFQHYVKHVPATMTCITRDDVAVTKDLPLQIIYHNHAYDLSLKGSYQILNTALSIEAVNYLYPDMTPEVIQKGLLKTLWAGRLEEIDHHIYIDGAHNTHAIDALIETAKTTFKDQTIWILFSALGDKDIPGMLERLKTISRHITISTFPDPRFQDLSEIAKDFIYQPDPFLAISQAKKEMGANTHLIITGSLHFIGYIKKHYKTM